MTANENITKTNNEIEQIKDQRNLDQQTAKNSALSSKNVGKYEF